MKSYFPEAIKQRMQSHLTPNMFALSLKERMKSSVKIWWKEIICKDMVEKKEEEDSWQDRTSHIVGEGRSWSGNAVGRI